MIPLIRSIELKNWKTHKNTKLDFSKGTNILIGQMGAGKSSLMDAISFALFGTFPAIHHKRVAVSRLIRSRPRQESSASIRLEMDVNGDSYAITRELSLTGKTAATIERNGSYLQSQPERVNEEIERILKVDYDLFSKAIYSEQNQLDYFLDLRSSDRKKQIDGLLGLDKFATAQDNTTSLINRVRDLVSESERMVREFDIVKSTADLKELRDSMQMLEKERSEAEKSVKRLNDEKSKTEIKARAFREMQNRKTMLLKDIEGIKGRLELLESEIKKADLHRLPAKSDALAEKSLLAKEIEAARLKERHDADAERNLHSEMAKLEVELSNAKKENAEVERIDAQLKKSEKDLVQSKIIECNKSIDGLSIDAAHSKSIVLETEKQLKELKAHLSKCPICERELDDDMIARITQGKSQLIAQHNSKARELEQELSRIRAELKDLTSLSNSITVMEEQKRKYAGATERIRKAELGLEISRKNYEKTKSEHESVSKAIQAISEKMQKNANDIEAIERNERHILDRERISKDLSLKTAEANSIIVDDKMVDALQKVMLEMQAELGKHTANIASYARSISEKEAQIKAKESEIEKINRMHEKLARRKGLIDNLSKFKLALSETQSVLRVLLINSINGIMHEVWKELYPYGDYQSVNLDASDDGYELKVKVNSGGQQEWESVESIASGGERSTACLAMRIAFSLVLVPNLKWLILDEPTHNIDQQGLSKFVKMFSETLPGIVDQVFIITHDEMLKQVSDARIYILNRNKEENGETRISEA